MEASETPNMFLLNRTMMGVRKSDLDDLQIIY